MCNIPSMSLTRGTKTVAGVLLSVKNKLIRFLIPAALVIVPGATLAKPLQQPVHIVAVEVNLAEKVVAPTLAEKISTEILAERAYYTDEGRAVVMHVTVDKLRLKSAGKAIMSNVPLVGMFAGRNENSVRANIRLIDQLSGENLGNYDKIEVSDSKGLSAGDVAGELGSTTLSFLPVPFLGEAVTTAGDMAASAGSHNVAETKMSRILARTAFYKIYGRAAAKIASQRRREARVSAQHDPEITTAATPPAKPVPVEPDTVAKATTTDLPTTQTRHRRFKLKLPSSKPTFRPNSGVSLLDS
jgi:hypothetical protein